MSEQVFLDFSLNFNLRQTKKNMPTIIYALFTFRGRQYKVNIGAKVYPTQWNKRKQIATISNGQTRLDNRNNEIVNKKIRSLLAIFEEKKNYLCENLERIDFLFEEMRQAINPKLKCRNYMEKEMHLSATLVFRKMVDKYVKEDSSKKIYLGYISAFEAFLKVKSIPNRLSAINGDTLTDYQQYLLDLNPRRIATHLNKIKGIRTLINHANRDKEIKANININSFVAIRDERSKEQKKSKQVPLTEKQLLAIYNYTNLKPREVEARDLFICQCLLGQRISDLPKIFKGEYAITLLDDENEVISFTVQKTREEATLYLFPVVKEILERYKQTGFKHIDLLIEDEKIVRRNEAKLNRTIKQVCKKVGLDSDVIYVEQIGEDVVEKKKKLFEMIHTHIARHTFITLMCRLGVSKEDVIIATAHTDTTMIDDVYLHETVNDKGTRLINSLKKIKGSTLFKIEEANNMVDTTMNEEETVKKPISTASVTNNITFDTLLDTQFFASKINRAVELQSQVGHLKNGKLCSYDNEITSLVSEIEKFSQSSTPDSDVAKQYVKQLSVGKQSDLYDSFREMIIKCVKIGISKDAIMQFINKALEIGLLDNERFTNIKEITTALLDKRNQG